MQFWNKNKKNCAYINLFFSNFANSYKTAYKYAKRIACFVFRKYFKMTHLFIGG